MTPSGRHWGSRAMIPGEVMTHRWNCIACSIALDWCQMHQSLGWCRSSTESFALVLEGGRWSRGFALPSSAQSLSSVASEYWKFNPRLNWKVENGAGSDSHVLQDPLQPKIWSSLSWPLINSLAFRRTWGYQWSSVEISTFPWWVDSESESKDQGRKSAFWKRARKKQKPEILEWKRVKSRPRVSRNLFREHDLWFASISLSQVRAKQEI